MKAFFLVACSIFCVSCTTLPVFTAEKAQSTYPEYLIFRSSNENSINRTNYTPPYNRWHTLLPVQCGKVKRIATIQNGSVLEETFFDKDGNVIRYENKNVIFENFSYYSKDGLSFSYRLIEKMSSIRTSQYIHLLDTQGYVTKIIQIITEGLDRIVKEYTIQYKENREIAEIREYVNSNGFKKDRIVFSAKQGIGGSSLLSKYEEKNADGDLEYSSETSLSLASNMQRQASYLYTYVKKPDSTIAYFEFNIFTVPRFGFPDKPKKDDFYKLPAKCDFLEIGRGYRVTDNEKRLIEESYQSTLWPYAGAKTSTENKKVSIWKYSSDGMLLQFKATTEKDGTIVDTTEYQFEYF